MTNIKLEPHQPIWVDRFERERDRLLAVTPDNPLGVFHIGSTAVPDLAAKPVLDVLAVFEGYDAARATADVLVMDGYELKHDQQDWVGLMRTTDEYSVYLHLRPRENETWRDQLVFRELLRDDPIAKTEYECAKHRAATEHPTDVDAYTDAKEATILSLVERAYEAEYADQLPVFENSG